MSVFFINIYNQLKNKSLLSIIILLLVVLSLLFFASNIKFEEDITKLIPSSDKSEVTEKILSQVNFADKIVVYLTTKPKGTLTDLTNYANALINELKKEKFLPYIKEIQGKVNESEIDKTLGFIYNNLPLFLSKEDYKLINKKLNVKKIDSITQNNYKTIISPSGIIAKKTIVKDPLGLTFIGLKKLQNLQANDNFELQNGFLVTKNHKNLLLFISPKQASNKTDKNTQFVNNLYELQQNLNSKFKTKAHSEYFGSTIIAVANASQIKKDVQFTISIALSVLMLILIFFYRKFYIPLVLFTPTILGGLTAIAFLYLFKGTISGISLGIGSVLLGITLDYSLHILTHFKENSNANQLYKDVTKPTLMSSFTTAIAFLCLIFVKSEALQDLGIFAAISVVSASVFALIFIPLAYRPKPEKKKLSNLIEKIAKPNYHKNKILIFSLLSVFIASIFFSKKVVFDNDISKMNFKTKALKSTEKKLDSLTSSNSKSLYSVSYGNKIDSVLKSNNLIANKLKKLKANGKIISFSSVGTLVLSEEQQKKRIEYWQQFWTKEKKETLTKNLIRSGNKLGFKSTTHNNFYKTLNKKFTTLSVENYKQLKTLFIDEFINSKNNFYTALSLIKVSENNYKYVTDFLKSNKNQIIIDRQQMNETFLGNLKTDFSNLLKYSFVALFLILFFSFKNIELTFITLTPIIVTWFITIGIMGILNIHFNIFNIIISAFIFGLGVDYSIFISSGLIKKYKYGLDELKTYKTSILLSVITTVLGIGVLIFAKHPALKSISTVSVIGIASAMLTAYTVQPLIFNILIKNRAKKGIAPIKFTLLLHSVLLNIFYAIGGMLLSVFSISILPLIPVSKKKKMTWLHKTMSKLVTATLYGNPFVKKRVLNPYNEQFRKPAIVISNHASALDTLTIGLLTHNVIYLVNDWVYKSPVFGLLARVLGFYPVSDGVTKSIEHLKEKVKQGYCLVVFPEAKRSLTNKIGRFHKGAFFLAKQLKLDILPIYLHGNSEVMPKKDFIIYNGSLTAKVGKRIKFDKIKSYGKTEREITINISKLYKKNFNKLRAKTESETYFKNILFSNYQFKGYELEQHVKKDFNKNKSSYHQLLKEIPFKVKINHIANDFGQIDILLISESIDRKITTFIKNKEKRTTAKNCYTIQSRKATYVLSLNKLNSEAEILLISKKITLNELKKLNYFNYKQVVLFNNSTLANAFLTDKTVYVKQTKNTIVLTNI